MMKTKTLWLAVVDQRCGTLWHGHTDDRSRLQLERIDRIEDQWEEHEHGRPSPLAAKNGHSHAAAGHESEERVLRFARDIASWLARHLSDGEVDSISLFAPPRVRGALRSVLDDRTQDRIDEHDGDLARLSGVDLARHPAVSALMDRA